MQKVEGIKSLDFKITALGHGVVNWNGPTTVKGSDGKDIDNHSMPKLRGYSNLTGLKSDKGFKFKKEATDIDFKKTPLYISQNCIRHHLFRSHAFDLHFAKKNNVSKLIASITGLMRGYVLPNVGQFKRTSPLLLEDFVDQLGNGNFEQMSRAGSKEKETNKKGEESSNSFFSKTTFGDTKYISYGSVSIEQLQFISLDNKFDRAAMVIKEGEGEQVAEKVQSYIKSLNLNLEPKATFHPNYVRSGTIFEEGEQGILLDNTAVKILIEETLSMLTNLSIRQGKGYMNVDEIEVDYNDSHKMMRIKRGDITSPQASTDFATYFYAKDE